MKKVNIVWRVLLALGVGASAWLLLAHMDTVSGADGGGRLLGILMATLTYLLLVIDLTVTTTLFPWGQRWRMLQSPLKAPLLLRLVSKAAFAIVGFYSCVNSVFCFGINRIPAGEERGELYTMTLLKPLFSFQVNDASTAEQLFHSFRSGLWLSAALFCAVVVFEVAAVILCKAAEEEELI